MSNNSNGRFERCVRTICQRGCELEQTSLDAIITTDADGLITSFNLGAGEICGIPPEEALGRPAGFCFRGGQPEFQSVIDRLKKEPRIRNYLTEFATATGSGTPVSLSASAIREESGGIAGLVLIAHDLSEIRRIERHLADTEHLATLGELAAGLAHEIKNPLAGIKGAIDVIHDSLPAGNFHREVLGDVLREVGRIDKIVKDLLNYAKPKPPTYTAIELSELAQRIIAFARTSPREGTVTVEFRQRRPIPGFTGDETQMEQVLLNLLLNAQEAVSPAGRIEVSLDFDGSETIRLEVRDNGPGIPVEIQDRIFQPFFTTRTNGTGLGLATCLKNVQYHGGTIEVQSTPGRGTTFAVIIPLVCRI